MYLCISMYIYICRSLKLHCPCSAKKTRPFLNLYRNEALSPIHQALPRCEVTHSDASRLPGSRSASLSSPATTKPSFRASSWD